MAHSPVFAEPGNIGEAPPAVLALHRICAVCAEHMRLEVQKLISTDVAHRQLAFTVFPCVAVQRGFRTEVQTARLALETQRVYAHVKFQCAFSSVTLIAHGAREHQRVKVFSTFMRHQQSAVRKHQTAHRAFNRRFFAVRPEQMHLKPRRVQHLIALRTLGSPMDHLVPPEAADR